MVRGMNRLDPEALRSRLKAAGVRSQKSYGQHFLIDGEVLDAALAAADLVAGERVIEIGPGPGVLIERLMEMGVDLVAFEADTAMVDILKADFPHVHVVQGDALHTIPQFLSDVPYKVVANIPYQITTALIRLFLEDTVHKPVSLTLLMQKEVGERLAAPARTGERGYLSVLVQYYATVSVVYAVSPASFWPEPAVDSAVVHMQVKAERPLPVEEEQEFFKYVKGRFMEPRKQLKNVLAGMRGEPWAEVVQKLAELGLPENIRAQELTQEDWLKLYHAHV